MNQRKLSIFAVATVIGLLIRGPAAVAQDASWQAADPPTIVFLMTDQQRWDCLGVLNPHIKTPNLDRLARQGILFRQAVCQAPMCVPSRYAMMLGLYPSQLEVKSKPYGRKNSSKYLYWREVEALWPLGKSLLIFQYFYSRKAVQFCSSHARGSTEFHSGLVRGGVFGASRSLSHGVAAQT